MRQQKDEKKSRKEHKNSKRQPERKEGRQSLEDNKKNVKPQAEKEEQEEVNIAREIIGTVLYFAFVILAVWLIITFVGQRTTVDGESMYSTLHDGDNLWVNKLAYRLHEPERFDIVVFPHVEEDGEKRYFIKRIIGMPGENIRIDEDGTIYINGEPLKEDYGYEVIEPNTIERAKDGVTLLEDEYFVMGDNRNHSFDSRAEEVGNIKRSELVGTAAFRIWPLSRFGGIE